MNLSEGISKFYTALIDNGVDESTARMVTVSFSRAWMRGDVAFPPDDTTRLITEMTKTLGRVLTEIEDGRK